MVSLLQSINQSINPCPQLTCLNNLLLRVSVSPDFFSENTISSNHIVVADFSLRSMAIQNSNLLFSSRFYKWRDKGMFGKIQKRKEVKKIMQRFYELLDRCNERHQLPRLQRLAVAVNLSC